MGELVDMASQFRGLPMGDLIGGPLMAACDAQVKLANATASFIKVVGFLPPPDPSKPNEFGDVRKALFKFTRPAESKPDSSGTAVEAYVEDVSLEVPLLAIVKVPNLQVTDVDITFDMEVKSSFSAKESSDMSAKAAADITVGWGVFSAKVHIEGSVSSHKENTRTSDNSAKYHVSVKAKDSGMPEGLARVLDIMNQAIAPTKIESKKAA